MRLISAGSLVRAQSGPRFPRFRVLRRADVENAFLEGKNSLAVLYHKYLSLYLTTISSVSEAGGSRTNGQS
jgi:hypothetical protein